MVYVVKIKKPVLKMIHSEKYIRLIAVLKPILATCTHKRLTSVYVRLTARHKLMLALVKPYAFISPLNLSTTHCGKNASKSS